MEKIRGEGEYPSVKKIGLITGGSDTTIARLKQEIAADQAPPSDSHEALEAFRPLWAKVKQICAAQHAQTLDEMKQDYDSALAENERMDGQVIAAEARLEKLREQHDELQSRVTAAQLQSTQARANSESDARQLAETLARLSTLQERFTTEGHQMQAQLAQATEMLHTSEIQLAGTRSESERMKDEVTKLDSRCRQLDDHRTQLEAQLQKNATELGEARTNNGVLSNKLTDASARFVDLQRRYNEELPALRSNLESAMAKCHATEVQLAMLQGQLKSTEQCNSSSPGAAASTKATEKRAVRSDEKNPTSPS